MLRLLLVVIVLLGAARESEARSVKMPVLGWTVELPDEPWTVHETTLETPTGPAKLDYFNLSLGDRVVRVMVIVVAHACEDIMLGQGGTLARDSEGELRIVEDLPVTWANPVVIAKNPISWTTCRGFGINKALQERSLQVFLAAEGTERRAEDEARLVAIVDALESVARDLAPSNHNPLDSHAINTLERIVAQARTARSPTTLPGLGVTMTTYPWRLDGTTLVVDHPYQANAIAVNFAAHAGDVGCAAGFAAQHTWETRVATPSWVPNGFHRLALEADNDLEGTSSLEVCADVPGGVLLLHVSSNGAFALADTREAIATLLAKVREQPPVAPAPLSLAPVAGTITPPRAANAWALIDYFDMDRRGIALALEHRWPMQPLWIGLGADRAACAGEPSAALPPEWKLVASKADRNKYSVYKDPTSMELEACTTARDGRRIRAWVIARGSTTAARLDDATAFLSAISANVGAEAPVVPGTLRRPLTWFPKRDSVGFGLGYRSGDTGGGVDLAVVLQAGALEINFGGMVSGPESATLLGKAVVNVFSFLDPRVSRVSLSFSAGATAFLYTKPGEDPDAEVIWLRGYLGAKLRVRCGLSVRASYEPSFSDTKPDVYGIGLEVATEGRRRASVCNR